MIKWQKLTCLSELLSVWKNKAKSVSVRLTWWTCWFKLVAMKITKQNSLSQQINHILQSLRWFKTIPSTFQDLDREFKVSLKPWYIFFLNFAKVTSHPTHQTFKKYQNFHCAVFLKYKPLNYNKACFSSTAAMVTNCVTKMITTC